ncbi:hypothetical protein JHN63_40460, partial [Streptomyces sp. MBT65]|uniref:hypothetical protein n=1 Tax=Streptomyces sp. MBT65 TaxID=1488395 RepID=UPI00190E0906
SVRPRRPRAPTRALLALAAMAATVALTAGATDALDHDTDQAVASCRGGACQGVLPPPRPVHGKPVCADPGR